MTNLTPQEFDHAIHQGLGRAFLHVKHHGDHAVRTSLLNAIVHNLVYDSQVEGSRATWLFSIIEQTDNLPYYEEALLHHVSTLDDPWDMAQAFDLLLAFAKRGSAQAKTALYKRFKQQSQNESWLGGEQIIELDGIPGFMHVAETLGQRMQTDPDYWDDDYLLSQTEETFGKATVQKAIEERLKTSKHLKFYLEQLTRSTPAQKVLSQEERGAQIRKRWPLDKILDDIAKATEVPKQGVGYHYVVFGRYGADADIEQIFRQLLEEERRPQLLRLLQIFRKRPLPDIPQKILDLAVGEDPALSHAAMLALSNCCDRQVHHLARKILQQANWERGAQALPLLIHNYQSRDIQLIQQLIRRLPSGLDRTTLHGIVHGVLNVCQQHPGLHDMLLWIYEQSPCMHCRYHAVQRLHSQNALPSQLRDECLVDGNEDIRAMIKEGDR